MTKLADLAAAEALDAADPLRGFRARFALPEGIVYLDGNSLGAAAHAVFEDLRKAAEEEWGQGLIRSWNAAGWFDLPLELGDRIIELDGRAFPNAAGFQKEVHALLTVGRPEFNMLLERRGHIRTITVKMASSTSKQDSPDSHVVN